MDCPDELEVDHIGHRQNGMGTENDNRKINLRVCEHYQNCSNRLPNKKTNGVVGVSLYQGKKWRATICVNGNFMVLGCFDTFDEAVQIRKAAEEKYFGEYSYDNSMRASSNYKE